MCSSVDDPRVAGEVLFDVAIVLQAAGLTGQAASAALQALDLFAAKGATLLASRVQDWLLCIAAENT
jgi:hypothetical protein